MADDSKDVRGSGGPQKDVSLGPACLIVVVIGAICLSVGMIAMAAMMSGSQGRRAARAGPWSRGHQRRVLEVVRESGQDELI